ncbi:MAG TPA: prepilin-type N-terminal cleavage/methylation domain-containing protein [Holophagaceae bacterium]|jgi:prepilin-type N-terminal cleavage/methylation domain-containing protein|nr:prepilin-type N-terminal cleavage/methylation domain-containing protein [Holophagaceae bacterium]
MKKQSGFTLIELLLVLAIIGIISAIAIPALLSQRARARDKSSTENMVGRVGDLVGQWDKFREAGLTSAAAKTSMLTYLQNTSARDHNPWNTTGASTAFNLTKFQAAAGTTASTYALSLAAFATTANLGQAQFGVLAPTPGNPGFIGGAVYLNASSTSDTIAHVKTKVTAIE